jgi:AAA domain
MTTPATVNPPSSGNLILSAEDWLNADFSVAESEVLIGTRENPLVRPLTKNLVQAAEKAFKTTFLMRLALGISTGETVFSSLPVARPRRVLYLHGELAPVEIQERLQEAASGLRRPLDRFFQGRSMKANLLTDQGRAAICDLAKEYEPEILIIDPWQSFISGADENSFKEVSPATAFMDWLIAESKITIFLAIHLGKDRSRGARGHSILAGWRDTLFALKRTGTTLAVGVEPRWARPPADLKLAFKNGTLWEGDSPGWTKQAEEIRTLLSATHGRLSREAIGLGLDLKGSTLRTALMRAEAKGAIHLDGDWVSLPSPSSLPASPNHPLLEGGGICDGDARNQ